MATSLSTGLQELFDWSRDLSTRLPLDSALGFERRLTHIPLDLYETQDEVVVHAYLPGFRQEKVQVELDQNRLLIKAERDLPENQNVNWIQVESPYGSVYRSLVIGPMIKADQIEAGWRDGVLVLRLPKVESAKPRPIPIQHVDHLRLESKEPEKAASMA